MTVALRPRFLRRDRNALVDRRGIVRADLGADAVFQRRDDFAARGVVLGIGAEHERHIQRQPHRIALNLHVAFLHDVEQADLNFAREVRQFVDGEDAAIGARQQSVMHRELAAQFVTALCRLDGIDVADQVGDGHIGRRQLFDVAFFGRRGMRSGASSGFWPAARGSGGKSARMDCRESRSRARYGSLRIEQRGERAQDAALRLPAQSQQNEIMPRKNCVDDLRHHRIVITDDAGKNRAAMRASFASGCRASRPSRGGCARALRRIAGCGEARPKSVGRLLKGWIPPGHGRPLSTGGRDNYGCPYSTPVDHTRG